MKCVHDKQHFAYPSCKLENLNKIFTLLVSTMIKSTFEHKVEQKSFFESIVLTAHIYYNSKKLADSQNCARQWCNNLANWQTAKTVLDNGAII